jgi:hypothetical protein
VTPKALSSASSHLSAMPDGSEKAVDSVPVARNRSVQSMAAEGELRCGPAQAPAAVPGLLGDVHLRTATPTELQHNAVHVESATRGLLSGSVHETEPFQDARSSDGSGALSVQGAADRGGAQQLLWNDTQAPIPAGCLHHLFERAAAAAGDRISLVAEDGTLRYAELNARANRLAAFLRAAGAGRGRFVGEGQTDRQRRRSGSLRRSEADRQTDNRFVGERPPCTPEAPQAMADDRLLGGPGDALLPTHTLSPSWANHATSADPGS